MFLHHRKFLSIPNGFSLVIEPLGKRKGLEPKSSETISFWRLIFTSYLKADPGEYSVLLGENMGNGFIFHP